jgi:hypothetical protein
MSTISLGFIFEDARFGELLNKVRQRSTSNHLLAHTLLQLLCVDQDARANFSVIRRARFFADLCVPLPHYFPNVANQAQRNDQRLAECYFLGFV